ncbi:MAG: hypothetical protein ACOC1U_04180 [Spirochaetota bacterium]
MGTVRSEHTQVRARADAALAQVADSFGMSRDERGRFETKPVARLIASLPFLAGCARAERTSVEHLGIYVLSVKSTRSVFFATEADDIDVFERLGPIMRFSGGDRRIIDRGMALIALMMVKDYVRDQHVDAILGKHNPVSTGAWDADAMIAELTSRVRDVSCPEMEEIMALGEDVDGWWTYE